MLVIREISVYLKDFNSDMNMDDEYDLEQNSTFIL